MPTKKSPAKARQSAKPDIFIGYAREERRLASTLAKFLESKGWSVWWDDKIRGGVFTEAISRALAAARCVIVMWSEKASESSWLLAEAQEGFQRGILLPVLLDEKQKFPFFFNIFQTVDLSNWEGSLPDSDREPVHPNLERIAEAAEAILESEAGLATTKRGVKSKQVQRHKFVRVPDGSRLALRVHSDEMRLEVKGGIDGGRARRKWTHKQIFNRTLRSVLRSPNRYEVNVQVAFRTSSESQATVRVEIVKPDGSVHSKPWKSGPLSGKDGEVDFATISVHTLKSEGR